MCGISGYFSYTRAFSSEELRAMTDAIASRGPDALGYFEDEVVALGHRRLSILDLSENANQPMFSANKRYVMVYNGEVYNFREIAAELKQKFNCDFRTSSDSEVILEAFANYGPDFVTKLNGMFAIAIYDQEKKDLYLFRDRIGIKPLHYFWDGHNFAFASEIKALTKAPFIPLSVNKQAVYNFLHLGFIPAPQSIYTSIKKLPSGSWIKISKDKLDLQQYWNLNQQVSPHVISNEKEALVKLSELLMSSVQYQIKSDVPFGVFLSGGIDSSLVAANAVSLSGVKVNTFSIGFKENRYNESAYARAIANYLNTNHHEFIVSYKDAMDLIDAQFEAYSEPFADSSSIPTLLVSKLARQHVTVTLSGEGGDELFHGYGSYLWARRLNNPFVKMFRNNIASILGRFKKYERHVNYFKYPSEDLIYSHILSQEQYFFSLAELNNLLTEEFSKNNAGQYTEQLHHFGIAIKHLNRNLKPEEKQSLFDLTFYLQDDLLSKVDRASMHFSLETRVPYLDHRIIEFAINLSPSLKNKGGVPKYILKEILYQSVPEKFFRRPKQGFAIPLEQWLKKELRFLIEDYLSKSVVEKHNYVNSAYTEELKKGFFNGKDYYYNRLWVLIILHKWLEKHNQ